MAQVVTGRGEIRASGRCTDHSLHLGTISIAPTITTATKRPAGVANPKPRSAIGRTRLLPPTAPHSRSQLSRDHRARRALLWMRRWLANRHEKSTWRRSARCLIRFFLILVGPE